jgi:hypothetical protein
VAGSILGVASLRDQHRLRVETPSGTVEGKQSTRLAGSEFAGHTGLLAARSSTDSYSMMLVLDDLRVTQVSRYDPPRYRWGRGRRRA